MPRSAGEPGQVPADRASSGDAPAGGKETGTSPGRGVPKPPGGGGGGLPGDPPERPWLDAVARYPRINAYCLRIRETIPGDLESFSIKDVPDANHRNWLRRHLRLREEGGLDRWQQELLERIGFNWTTGKVPKPPKPPEPPRVRPPRKRKFSRTAGDGPGGRVPSAGGKRLSPWDLNFEDLRREVAGAKNPLGALIEAEDDLFLWARRQLVRLLKGNLSEEHRAGLRALFPRLSESDDLQGLGRWRTAWDNYRVVHGRSPFLADETGEPGESGETDHGRRMKASRWASRQRGLRERGKLPDWQIELLDEFGFKWRPRSHRRPDFEDWFARLDKLVELQAEHGSPLPLKVATETGLKVWISRVRKFYSDGRLPPEVVRVFKEKGFAFDGFAALNERRERDWQRNYKKLQAFCREFGHPRVPARYPEDPGLSGWLLHQRDRMKKGTIEPDKRRALEELGVRRPVSNEERAAARSAAG